MNKKELINMLQANLGEGYSKAETTRVLDVVFSTIKDALEEGDSVRVTGFGSFKTKQYPARTARNPRSGEPVQVPARRVVRFKQFKSFTLPTE